jgi:hypothetical protein
MMPPSAKFNSPDHTGAPGHGKRLTFQYGSGIAAGPVCGTMVAAKRD